MRDCYEFAGRVGVDPDGLTLCELYYMDRAKRIEAWKHTATLRSDMFLHFRNRSVSPRKLHPMLQPQKRKRRPIKPTPGGVEMLTRILCDGHGWARPEKKSE
ncbi:MAG: hypothetical protein JW741_25425 [Sedimentisphaerales bacterium]|nr:hypothetical protein [Sedimentisphaerales bacterium]